MKRGFPRPTMKLGKLSTWKLNDDEKEKWKGKVVPLPFSAREEDLSLLHNGRVGMCLKLGNCMVCGDWVEPNEAGEVWIYSDSTGRMHEDSGPFHEKCARLTQAMCPVVNKMKHNYVFKKAIWAEVGPFIRGKHDFSLKDV